MTRADTLPHPGRAAGYSPEARAEMINTLASRPAFPLRHLAAARDKKIMPADIRPVMPGLPFDDADLTAALADPGGDARIS